MLSPKKTKRAPIRIPLAYELLSQIGSSSLHWEEELELASRLKFPQLAFRPNTQRDHDLVLLSASGV